MKRIIMMFALTALVVVALSLSAVFASAAPRLNGGDDKCRQGSDHNHCVNNNDGGIVTNHGGQQGNLNGPNR